MTPPLLDLFGRAVSLVERRLLAFGTAPERFGLVHGDMRLANVLLDGSTLKLIDFDDCGFSWFLYDCATTVSFFEHEPHVPDLLAAWVHGYRQVRDLPEADVREIPTFVLLRRLLLVAWLTSRPDTDLARNLGTEYTRQTGRLCEVYLKDFADT